MAREDNAELKHMTLDELWHIIDTSTGRVEIHALLSPEEVTNDVFWAMQISLIQMGLTLRATVGIRGVHLWKFTLIKEQFHTVHISGYPQ